MPKMPLPSLLTGDVWGDRIQSHTNERDLLTGDTLFLIYSETYAMACLVLQAYGGDS